MLNVGFRSHKVITAQTFGVLDTHGAYIYLEVDSATDTLFYPNAINPTTGDPVAAGVDGIPIKAGVTKVVPMAVYNFKADAAVTVVAYRM
jgi:hypothetical protein